MICAHAAVYGENAVLLVDQVRGGDAEAPDALDDLEDLLLRVEVGGPA